MSIYCDTLILLYCCFIAGLFGAVMGSFLNCAAWRMAHGESFVKGRSHCTACGHVLGALDLIPVLSWLFLRGKCRYCRQSVSIRYPLTELFMAAMSIACLLRFDLSAALISNLVFGCCLFCLSLVDLECYRIPDGCLLLPAGVWLVCLPWSGLTGRDILLHAASGVLFGGGMLLLSLLFDRMLGKESMGGGDIKLLALMGLYLGLLASLFALVLACILGLLMGLLQRKRVSEHDGRIPFGPSIAAAAWIMLLWGQPFVSWYLSLLM